MGQLRLPPETLTTVTEKNKKFKKLIVIKRKKKKNLKVQNIYRGLSETLASLPSFFPSNLSFAVQHFHYQGFLAICQSLVASPFCVVPLAL
ncbi:hypothetical protein Csa_000109 [Cucumis sativus]|uniref:Uncharacterized protein n=1 Tax=Cucumis sativus TaxID=3659 RepID=A0A0A0KJP1_CUCSA|nr:hypothetical protein Csa_000109 [Cucumis sativus]